MSAPANTPTCASCIHLSLDGRFCYNWHRPMELSSSCPAHSHTSAEHDAVRQQVRNETTQRKRNTVNHDRQP